MRTWQGGAARRRRGAAAALAAALAWTWTGAAAAQAVATCGAGYLEIVDGHPVLHLKGTPYEMGWQHGQLLKNQIKEVVHHLFEVKAKTEKLEFLGQRLNPRQIAEAINTMQQPFIPARFKEELRGLADGSGLPLADLVAANGIPELFHCSGFALLKQTTADGEVLHGRVLDYAVDWRLQEFPVAIVAEPHGRIPFVNVTYAGFIGSVTGMNAAAVSFGEMGGSGLGLWHGTPMAFLMRRGLEEAHDLDEAVAVFRDAKRTCEYYYVFADGRRNQAVGVDGGALRFELVPPGAQHPRLPTPVPHTVLLSAGQRYGNLCAATARVLQGGKFTIDQAWRMMDAPVAMNSNLHNVLMQPATGKLWIAHAAADKSPAWRQRRHALDFAALRRQPAPTGVPALPPPPPAPTVAAAP
jgi:hypothetical protein